MDGYIKQPNDWKDEYHHIWHPQLWKWYQWYCYWWNVYALYFPADQPNCPRSSVGFNPACWVAWPFRTKRSTFSFSSTKMWSTLCRWQRNPRRQIRVTTATRKQRPADEYSPEWKKWTIITRRTFSIYRQTSNIRHILVGNKIVDHSDVVGASPIGDAPTASRLNTWLQWINGQRQLQDETRNI